MMRGTFANIRIKNGMVPGKEGNLTKHIPSGDEMSFFDASERYRTDGVPLMLLAGKEYGSGSSRDWAGKGPALLGVRVVIAQSYERIHRSNLIGMGILPLQFAKGEDVSSLGLVGDETFDVVIDDSIEPLSNITVSGIRADGSAFSFVTKCRIDTPVEKRYYKNGGILHTVLKDRLAV